MTPIPSNHSSYSCGERYLRTCIFQAGVQKGRFESFLTWVFNIFSQKTLFPKTFDPARADRGVVSLQDLGAKIRFVQPKDGMAKIQMMTLSAQDLDRKIRSFGAKWDEVHQNSQKMLVIIPPAVRTSDWQKFEKSLLRLKWPKREIVLASGEKKEVIVTAENARFTQPHDWYQNLFLCVNSASESFVMQTGQMGFYLGLKQDVCGYDPRGTWKSEGNPSEAGYYNDIAAVYKALKAHYQDPSKMWISTACGGSGPSAYLKSLLHRKGVNLLLQNPYSDLKADFIDSQSWFVRKIGNYFFPSSIESRDIKQNKPKETKFRIQDHWKDLPPSQIGKVLIISVKNDQYGSPGQAQRMIDLAKKVNTNVHALELVSKARDPHRDRFYFPAHAARRDEALKFIFA